MSNCRNNCRCNDCRGVRTNQLQPVTRVSANSKLVLINDQIAPLSAIAAYINPTSQPLDNFEDGTILMVGDNGLFVVSGIRFDSTLNAIVYDGKIIADEVEVSNTTFKLSQRVSLSSFGTQLSIDSALDDIKTLPVYTKYDESGSLGNFAQTIGAETEIEIQLDDSATFTGSSYTPPPTVGTTTSNVIRGKYRFAEAGINARISVTVTNQQGENLILFGTESYPYAEFVTSLGDTIVEYPGTIADVPGLIYTTVIETYDPETREASTAPLNILGSAGVFRAYLIVDAQTRGEVGLAGTGDVSSSGAAVSGDLAIFSDASAKNIESIGINITEVITFGDNVSSLLNDAGYLDQVFHDATLEGTGSSQSPLKVATSIQGGISVIGFWNADLNDPDLTGITATQGQAYQVSVAGSSDINGETNWAQRDLVVWNEDLAGNWFKIDSNDDVLSVQGTGGPVQRGAVVISPDDLDDTGETNKFASQAQLNQIATNQSDVAVLQGKVGQANVEDTTLGAFSSASLTEIPGLSLDAPNDGDFVCYIGIGFTSNQNVEINLAVAVNGALVLNSGLPNRTQKKVPVSVQNVVKLDGLTAGDTVTVFADTDSDTINISLGKITLWQ